MFLIRLAFWLTLVVILLPADGASTTAERSESPSVDAMEAISAARAAIEDLSEICGRRPAVCETSQAALQTFGQKAKYGARTLYEYLDDTVTDPAGTGGADRAG